MQKDWYFDIVEYKFTYMELTQDTKNILGLKLPTDPWGQSCQEISFGSHLSDHADEQKKQ